MTSTTLERPTSSISPSRSAYAAAGVAPTIPPVTREEATLWFDSVYQQADGEMARVPWAEGVANPALITWLNATAPSLVRPGGRVAVVGCGLGHDAVELVNRGYDVLAFDVAPSAVHWAQRLHQGHEDRFIVADVCELPSRLRHRFDLVVECCTLQSVPPSFRPLLATGMTDLLGPRGVLLAICRGRADDVALDDFDSPPYPLTKSELLAVMKDAGLVCAQPVDDFEDDNVPPVRRLRGTFRRA